jgi:hypothetical protein
MWFIFLKIAVNFGLTFWKYKKGVRGDDNNSLNVSEDFERV